MFNHKQFERAGGYFRPLITGITTAWWMTLPSAANAVETGTANVPKVDIEHPLLAVLAGMGVVAGLCLGIVYRHLSEQCDENRKQAVAADAELRALLAMTDDAVLLMDDAGKIRAVNPAAKEIFGYSASELCGKNVSEIIHTPLDLSHLTRNGPAALEGHALGADGEKLDVNISLGEVQLTAKPRFLALVRRLEAAGQAAAEAGANEAQSELKEMQQAIGKFSHEFNNLLTGILGNISLAIISSPTDPALSERLSAAKRTSLRAQELVRKLVATIDDGRDEFHSPAIFAQSKIINLPQAVQQPVPGHPCARVLILDDEEAICDLVLTALGSAGIEVKGFQQSEPALAAYKEANATGTPFDLVITDLNLPGDITGTDFAARIRAINHEAKILVSSGYDNDPIVSNYKSHGFVGVLSKPYEINRLTNTVAALLPQKATRQTA
jgi:PAS domain S-box-containing protein